MNQKEKKKKVKTLPFRRLSFGIVNIEAILCEVEHKHFSICNSHFFLYFFLKSSVIRGEGVKLWHPPHPPNPTSLVAAQISE